MGTQIVSPAMTARSSLRAGSVLQRAKSRAPPSASTSGSGISRLPACSSSSTISLALKPTPPCASGTAAPSQPLRASSPHISASKPIAVACNFRTRSKPPAPSSKPPMLSTMWRSESLRLAIAAGPRQTERAHRDDAALNLVGAAADREAARLHVELAEIGCLLVGDARRAHRRMRARDLLQHFEHELRRLSAEELQPRGIFGFGLADLLQFERVEIGSLERHHLDLGLRHAIEHPGILVGAGRLRRKLQARQSPQSMDRRARANALFGEQRRAHGPAIADPADDILQRHDDIVEEHFAELVIAGECPDRARLHAVGLRIDQH